MLPNTSKQIKITILGSGTSSGVPVIGCKCATCRSIDPHDKRLRASLLIQSDNTNIIIDTTPDFRMQMLQNEIDHLDAIFFTHPHFDHIGGFDDIRALNFAMHREIQVYLNQYTLDNLHKSFYYAFEVPEQMGGGVPLCTHHLITDDPIEINGLVFTPINMFHGRIPDLGYRIGNFAYLTDTNFIPESEYPKLQNLDFLVIDGLRPRPHPTHFSFDEAIAQAKTFNPKRIILTHLTHDVKHSEADLPDGVELAYDGMQFSV